MLIGGFLKIFAPIFAGSVAAAELGLVLGTALGLGLKHTAFMIVVPVMAGGVGEGAIPLSIGYSSWAAGTGRLARRDSARGDVRQSRGDRPFGGLNLDGPQAT